MTIELPKARSPFTNGDEPAWDLELIVLSSTDYSPVDATGKPVACRGFVILGATGTVKIDTPAGKTITIPTGLMAGVFHAIEFTKMYSGSGTTATSLMAGT